MHKGGGREREWGFVWEKFLVPEGQLDSVHYMFLLSCQCSLALLLRTAVWEGLVTLKRRLAGTFDVALCNVNGYSLNPPKASSFILWGHSCVLPCSVWSVKSGSTFASALKSSLNLRILLTLTSEDHPLSSSHSLRAASQCGLCLCADSSEVFQHQTLNHRCHVHHRCDMWLCVLDSYVADGAACGVCALKLSLYCPTCLCDRVSSCWMMECSRQICMKHH